MRSMKRFVIALVAVGCLIALGAPAYAGSIIWGNNASFGNVTLEAFDSATGLLIPGQQFLVPNVTARGDNGRGVAVLGHTIYYTTANSGKIYITNDLTHSDDGILVDTGFPGIANVATDGTFIYANSYQSDSGVINKYNTSGVLVGTVTVGVGFFGRDGFEVQNNPSLDGGATTFISNRGDATSPYDVYMGDGTLLVSSFINPFANGYGTGQTGIAYDGNDYFISDIFNNRLFEYSGTGVFIRIINLSANPKPFGGTRYLEDLSAVGNTINNPPPDGQVPEPTSLVLLGTGLVGAARAWKKRKS